MDKKIHFSLPELGKATALAIVITAIICMFFYQSAWGFLVFPLVWLFCCRRVKLQEQKKRMQALEEQFMHGMETLNQAVQAGLSMENAWREVEKDAGIMYGESSEFYQKVKDMNNSVALNMPIEQLFLEFAYYSQLEDAISFAEVFAYGKRCGGNWKKMIDTVIHHMKDRYDVRKEIAVLVAEKQMEQRIMNFVPLGMIAFLQISAGDYVAALYHNWLGILCMSFCLSVYIAAIILSERILEIKV